MLLLLPRSLFPSLFYYEGEEFSSLKLEYIFVFGLEHPFQVVGSSENPR